MPQPVNTSSQKNYDTERRSFGAASLGVAGKVPHSGEDGQPVLTMNQKKPDMITQTLQPGDLVTLREIEGLRPFELTHPCDYNGEPNYIETDGCQFNIISVKDDVVELGYTESFILTKRCHRAHCVLVSKYEDRPKTWITEKNGKIRIHELSEEAPTFNHITAEISCNTSPEMLQKVISLIVNRQ